MTGCTMARLCVGLAMSAVPGFLSGCTAPDRLPLEHVPPRLEEYLAAFEVNEGQTAAEVRYVARAGRHAVFLTESGMTLVLHSVEREGVRADRPLPDGASTATVTSTVLRVHAVGAQPGTRPRGELPLAGKSHHFVGPDPEKWRTRVGLFAAARYAGIYPGVDWVVHGSPGSVKSDFLVAAGTDPAVIRLQFDGATGLDLDDKGGLRVQVPNGSLRQSPPVAYQAIDGKRRAVRAGYEIHGTEIGFRVEAYDRTRPLVIDPRVSWHSSEAVRPEVRATGLRAALRPLGQPAPLALALGGSGNDWARGIALDPAGDVYIVGTTFSADFPAPGARPRGQQVAFVAKLDHALTGQVWVTYLGAEADVRGNAIAVDAAGQAHIAGSVGAGGSGASPGLPIAPTTTPLQPQFGGLSDAFVAKLGAAGDVLLYSSYLGGGSAEDADGIALDLDGHAYVAGRSSSSSFATRTATPPRRPFVGGHSRWRFAATDAFVAKVNPRGTNLVYFTFVGGSGDDDARAIAVDLAGNAYITGHTTSSDLPMRNPVRASFEPISGFCDGPVGAYFGKGSQVAWDAFVAKLDTTGADLLYSTYLGGNDCDYGLGIAVDAAGRAYIVGATEARVQQTPSPFAPLLNALPGVARRGQSDGFVIGLETDGGLRFATLLGGSDTDAAHGVSAGGDCRVHVAGSTLSTDFPPVSLPMGGAFVASFDNAGSLQRSVVFPDPPWATNYGAATSPDTLYAAGHDSAMDVIVHGIVAGAGRVGRTVMIPSGHTEFSASRYEVDVLAGAARITIVRRGLVMAPASVRFLTLPGTATPGLDYLDASQIVQFAAGQTAASVTVPILPSAAAAGSATVWLVLRDDECVSALGLRRTAVLSLAAGAVPQ
jgi:hypothetical protein